MMLNHEAGCHLDDLRTALAQGMTHWVGGLVEAALIAGCSKRQLMQAASGVGQFAAKEAVGRAVDEWSWRGSRRKSVAAEVNRSFGVGLIA